MYIDVLTMKRVTRCTKRSFIQEDITINTTIKNKHLLNNTQKHILDIVYKHTIINYLDLMTEMVNDCYYDNSIPFIYYDEYDADIKYLCSNNIIDVKGYYE